MKILFVFPYPSGTAASQRFRFEQYLPLLKKKGIDYDLASFWNEPTWRVLYKKGHYFQKICGLCRGFIGRWILVARLYKYDKVFVHREATVLGWPFFEWIVTTIFRKPLIFDFDDAIWIPNTSEANRVASWLKFHKKFNLICQWASKISAGNDYLKEYASKFNKFVEVHPTVLDTNHLHVPCLQSRPLEKITIGWTGTHSTIIYLEPIINILKKLEQSYNFSFLVISNIPPTFELDSLKYLPWNKATEIQDLCRIDIGIMPLYEDPWAQGKCGFKALQYMSLEIVTVASAVGVNTKIIEHEHSGFLVNTPDEWENILQKLLQNESLREKIGKAGRQTVLANYSVIANEEAFLRLLTA